MWKIAVVDDDLQTLEGMREILPWHRMNCEWVGEAQDGQGGLEISRELNPDIVITDIYMPVMDGLTMIEQLRKENFQRKIIILSGYSDFEYARKALRLQVDDYLSKPVTLEEIVNVIEKAVAELEETHANEIREQFLSFQFNQQLTEALYTQALPSAERLISDYIEALRFEKVGEARHIQSIAKELWATLSYSLFLTGHPVDQLCQQGTIYKKIQTIHSLEQLKQWILSEVEFVCIKLQRTESFKHKKTVEFMLQYAQEHYSEDITLDTLSEKLYLSRNYLNKIFKQTMGETYTNYVISVKMEKAKMLILEGNDLIYEVAEKVGYKNIPYFSARFKKHFGVNPSDL